MSDMHFTMTSGGLPVGSYPAKFMGVDKFEENIEKYGLGIILKFQVLAGEHEGEEASRICSAKLSPKSALTKFAVSLKGSKIESGEQFSFTPFVGSTGSILVTETQSGATRIETFLKT